MADLWQEKRDAKVKLAEPLAARMRPRNLDQFAGQQHFLGPGMLLRRMLEADQLTSVIFYGPPGTGKTTLAELIAGYTQRHFDRGNAAAVGVKDVRHVLDQARKRLEYEGKRTIFFLDEIHRFNRAQQDVLLGDVERGIVTLIGATTENPFFAVNNALVSRSQIFQFEPLSEDDIVELIRRAIADKEHGFGEMDITIDDDAIAHWATISDGDARRALSALEIAVLSEGAKGRGAPGSSGQADSAPAPIRIALSTAEQSIQQKAIAYDRDGDAHHDAISAYIKSVRGSDADAAIYWLAKMLHAGEDPMFIARRIAILASEDIGNADPRALQVAASCYEIVHRIGLPEARITLAQATTYLATAPKSNASYMAINQAMSDVKTGRTVPVPRHLRSGAYAGAKQLGNATDYKYAHNAETGYVEQTYLGVDKTYYQPVDRGYEKRINEYLAWIARQRTQQPSADADDTGRSRRGGQR
jgi:putative ATPase